MKLIIPKYVIENLKENDISLMLGTETTVYESVAYDDNAKETYEKMLPQGIRFIGVAAKDVETTPQLEGALSLCPDKIIYNFSTQEILPKDFQIEIESNESFIKRANFAFLKIQIPRNLNSSFFCRIEGSQELFYTSELSAFKVEKAEKKKKGAKKPILKENPLKDLAKNIKFQLRTSLEESLRLNKSMRFPVFSLEMFTNSSDAKEEEELNLEINAEDSVCHSMKVLSLENPLEETITEILPTLPEKYMPGQQIYYNEFFAIPLFHSSGNLPLIKRISRTPDNWNGKLETHSSFQNKPVNVHKGLSLPKDTEIVTIRGSYAYFHYLHDGFNDEGWGCAYRSLQSVLSWFILSGISEFPFPRTIKEIQELVATMGDQGKDFVGSNTWIGSMDVGYVISLLTGFEHKILFLQNGAEILTYVRQLKEHLTEIGSPVMFGGADYAYTLLGISEGEEETKFLILDPHYTGTDDGKTMYDRKGIAWRGLELFKAGSYYNFCLPTLKKAV